jgi:hypothetical protein
MKRLNLNILMILAVIFSLGVITTSCSDDDDGSSTPVADLDGDGIPDSEDGDIDGDGVPNGQDNDPTDPDVGAGDGDNNQPIPKTGAITSNETWSSDNIYILNQKVVVEDGVTLTIEPGTIIKGSSGSGSLASALIVARGGKIEAVGTPDQPIIFTSEQDNIAVGETAGTNLDQNDRGLWGGVLILGKAPCSFEGDVDEVQIEGIPASDTFGLYGGNDPADDSGSFQYVSIRHGGALIGEGNEINGLTMGGVGTGTEISHVEVVANLDDAFEWFGGTVNASNLFVWAQGDDAFDIDQSYSGTIDNAMAVLGDVSDHGFEIDGPEGTFEDEFTLRNATLVGNMNTDGGEFADFRSGARGLVENVYAYNFKSSSDIEIDDETSANNYNNGDLSLANWEIVLPSGVNNVSDVFNNTTSVDTPGFGTEGTAVTEGNQTVGATTSEFAWTYSNNVAGLGF